MKCRNKLIAALLAATMVVSMFVGCGDSESTNDNKEQQSEESEDKENEKEDKKEDEKESSGDEQQDAEPVEFSYLRPVWGAATYTPDGPYELAVEEAANVKIDAQIIPVVEYDAKAKMIVSGKDFPDVMWALGPVDVSWREIENQGAFYPIEDLLESHPAVKATVSDSVWEMMRNEDGHIYFIPNTTSSNVPFFMYYRKDWFDELGIAEPTTIGELEAALEKIQAEKEGVIPMTVGLGEIRWMFKEIGTSFGAVINSWQPSEDDPNTLIPSYMTQEQKDYLFWLQDIRERGLLDAEADLNPDYSHGKQKFMTGQAACYPGGYPDMIELYSALLESDPEAEIGVMSPLVGPDGIQGGLRVNFPVDRGMYFNAATDPETIEGIFDFLEWTLTDGFELYYYGIEGEMYTKNEDGTISSMPDSTRGDVYQSPMVEPLRFLNREDTLIDFANYKTQFEALGIGDKYDYWYDMFQVYVENRYYDYLMPTVASETNASIGSQIQESYLNEVFGSVILNPEITEEDYDAAIAAWLEAGGQAIIDEFNAAQTSKEQPAY